jgi:hypothetical protein
VEAGRIVESGSHAQLMARPDGAYRRFVELQAHGASETPARASLEVDLA